MRYGSRSYLYFSLGLLCEVHCVCHSRKELITIDDYLPGEHHDTSLVLALQRGTSNWRECSLQILQHGNFTHLKGTWYHEIKCKSCFHLFESIELVKGKRLSMSGEYIDHIQGGYVHKVYDTAPAPNLWAWWRVFVEAAAGGTQGDPSQVTPTRPLPLNVHSPINEEPTQWAIYRQVVMWRMACHSYCNIIHRPPPADVLIIWKINISTIIVNAISIIFIILQLCYHCSSTPS